MSPAMTLAALLLLGIGGGAGSLGRWGLQELGHRLLEPRLRCRQEMIRPGLTALANVIACFVLGIVVAQLGSATGAGKVAYLMLAAGFCGGLSTLSTAAMDVLELLRSGTYSLAIAYVMLTIGTGMGALWVGLVIAT